MKSVLFVLAHMNYTGGVARVLTTLCNNLDLEKYDVTILPLYRTDKELLDMLKPGIKVKKGLGFYFKGLNDIMLRLPHSLLYRVFVGGKYDIEVAFQTSVPTKIVGASLNKKAVHIFWMHGYRVWKKEYKSADRVICVSKCNAEKCARDMQGQVNVGYCYNLTDDRKIIEASKEMIDIDIDYNFLQFISVGRLSPEKGYVRLVRILSDLKQEGLKFKLILVGDGPSRDDIIKEIEETQTQDIITLTGAQTNPHKFTSKSDVFICSSFSEGYSTACTEAAILGVPIITTNVPGGKEIIEDAECGLLTEMDDESLKSAIRSVIVNPSIVDEWKATMTRTSEKFRLESRKKSLSSLFDEFTKMSDSKINE